MANLGIAFQSLPEIIKEWLSDENVAYIIDEVNQRYNFTEENNKWRVISRLVLRLCVQDLEPRDFINELSHWLNISFDSAKHLTQEIEEKILKPIEAPLKIDVGVDLKLLYFANPAAMSSLRETSTRTSEVELPLEVQLRPIEKIATPQFFAEAKKDNESQTKTPASKGEVFVESTNDPKSPKLTPGVSVTEQKSLSRGASPGLWTHGESNPEDPSVNFGLGPSQAHSSSSLSEITNKKQGSEIRNSEPAKPFLLHEEKEFHPSGGGGSSFSYKPSMYSRPQQPMPTPKARIQAPPLPSPPIIKRVVHYSRFLTRIMNNKSPHKKDESKVKLPKSRWFI